MKGDFSGLNFDRTKHFSSVWLQQGRPLLDADLNEQTSILLHYLRALAADLIGSHGGPFTPPHPRGLQPMGGFGIAAVPGPVDAPEPDRYSLTPGRYYIDGLLCENDESRQSEAAGLLLPGKLERNETFLLYLDAWERSVNFLQDDHLREVALGEVDTATRSQVVWRVRATDHKPDGTALNSDTTRDDLEDWKAWVEQWQPDNRGRLQARARIDAAQATDPCTASPEASYRGPENQLYRVEIHRGGGAGEATFMWSRDNGSDLFPVRRVVGDTIFLEHLGRDSRTGMAPGNWVELVDETNELTPAPGLLLQVDSIDPRQTSVKIRLPRSGSLHFPVYDEAAIARLRPLLRRWNQRESDDLEGSSKLVDGAVVVTEGVGEEGWLPLEDGVQIQFQTSGQYTPGDYWLIRARTATGDIVRPDPKSFPGGVPPHGVDHHFAPLALVSLDGGGNLKIQDCRNIFMPMPRLEP